ncbi:VIR protein [Plasmodium vivax]|uniref:VIR protein n=1 Tax=Plasmodium vivax TaxID=5855 RepID=A0A1G4GS89_PLAVI|nr:VIR protein [Plasmodium vivax]
MDIEKWKRDFPFLINVWNKINDFDKDIENDSQKSGYVSTCSYFFSPWTGGEDKYEHFCMKLIRNLGHRSNNDFLKHTSERCNNLNIWIYNSMKKHGIPENIITKCFEDYNGFMRGIGTDPRCSYYSYDTKYNEPINIIKLNIFESNMDIIQSTLDGLHDSINLPLRMYICECINIYKAIYKQYCHNKDDEDQRRILTCSRLDAIKKAYDFYLSTIQHKMYKIPSLDEVEEDYLNMCVSEEPKSALTVEMARKITALQDSTEDGERKSGDIPPISTVTDENQGSSMTRTVSTAFGTVAGASSILALLYKFTPGRRWMHSGIGRNRGRISNHLYGEEPNELLFDGFQGEDMSSYNARYNIAYGSV